MKLTHLKTKFRNKWVLARVVEKDKMGQVTDAEPLSSSSSRKYIEQQLKTTTERHVTVIYTGKAKPRI